MCMKICKSAYDGEAAKANENGSFGGRFRVKCAGFFKKLTVCVDFTSWTALDERRIEWYDNKL